MGGVGGEEEKSAEASTFHKGAIEQEEDALGEECKREEEEDISMLLEEEEEKRHATAAASQDRRGSSSFKGLNLLGRNDDEYTGALKDELAALKASLNPTPVALPDESRKPQLQPAQAAEVDQELEQLKRSIDSL